MECAAKFPAKIVPTVAIDLPNCCCGSICTMAPLIIFTLIGLIYLSSSSVIFF